MQARTRGTKTDIQNLRLPAYPLYLAKKLCYCIEIELGFQWLRRGRPAKKIALHHIALQIFKEWTQQICSNIKFCGIVTLWLDTVGRNLICSCTIFAAHVKNAKSVSSSIVTTQPWRWAAFINQTRASLTVMAIAVLFHVIMPYPFNLRPQFDNLVPINQSAIPLQYLLVAEVAISTIGFF